MEADGYQSYLVRIRRRAAVPGPADGIRADIEDLLGGSRVCVQGDVARSLASDIEALLGQQRVRDDALAPEKEST